MGPPITSVKVGEFMSDTIFGSNKLGRMQFESSRTLLKTSSLASDLDLKVTVSASFFFSASFLLRLFQELHFLGLGMRGEQLGLPQKKKKDLE